MRGQPGPDAGLARFRQGKDAAPQAFDGRQGQKIALVLGRVLPGAQGRAVDGVSDQGRIMAGGQGVGRGRTVGGGQRLVQQTAEFHGSVAQGAGVGGARPAVFVRKGRDHQALKVVGKKKEDVKVVTSGAGAAAISIVKLLLSAGFKNITMCDRKGAIYKGRDGLNWIKEEMAEVTNPEHKSGSLADMLVGADVFIGVSAPGMVTKEMVQTMNKDAIIFACANPTPEIFPDEAKAGGARVVSTGRSDYPNQINNVLAFPGIFRGAFDVRASDINEEMKIAASNALANLISDEELNENYIIPAAFDPRVGPAVAKAVAEAARKSGVARI